LRTKTGIASAAVVLAAIVSGASVTTDVGR
jgi:hypothetical protein